MINHSEAKRIISKLEIPSRLVTKDKSLVISPVEIITKIKQDYNTMAADWHFTRQAPSPLKVKLLDKLKPGQQVLDVGCGNGLVIPAVLRHQVFYTGLDMAHNLLKIARKNFSKEIKNGQVKLILGEANKLPFAANQFDAVISFAVMHHIPGPELRLGFLKEIRRVLKPQGRVIIINWNLLNAWPRQRFKIDEQLQHQQSRLGKNDVFVPWKATGNKIISRYLHIFSKSEILDLAKQAKFSTVKVSWFNRAGQREINGEELVVELKK